MPATVPARDPQKSEKYRQEILWSGPCAYCGDPVPTQVDHVMPRSRGGGNERSNLVPACRMCNMEKLDFTPEEWKEWRLAEGLGWPPKSQGQFIAELVQEARERYGEEAVRAAIARFLDRSRPEETPC